MGPLDNRNQAVVNRPTAGDSESQAVNKRRSSRVVIDIQVTVFGQDSAGKIFQEDTTTVTVSIYGACVVMQADIDPQKPALLVNTKTNAEVQCRVVHRKDVENGRREIGFEFDSPHPRIWGIGFPPDDWDPAERKRPVWTEKPLPVSPKGTKK
jgi:hypothetical protein